MRTAVLVLAAAALALPVHSETGPVLQVEFSNPGLSPSHWILIIHPDGNGHFRSDRGNAPAKDPQTIEAPNVDRDIQLSAGFAERVFQTVHNRNWFNVDCESHLKVAFQGWKKLSYSGPDGQGVCAFSMTPLDWIVRRSTLWRPRGMDAHSRFTPFEVFWSGWQRTRA